MLESRMVKLSVYYFLKDKLDDGDWGSTGYANNELVTLKDAYPTDEELDRIVLPENYTGDSNEIVLPVVAIDSGYQNEYPYELGSGPGTARQFIISIFGRERGETDDLSQQIYEWFRDNNISLNNYNEGFPPTVTPTQVGTIEVDRVSLVPINIYDSPNVADKHRRDVSFLATTYISAGSEETFATS